MFQTLRKKCRHSELFCPYARKCRPTPNTITFHAVKPSTQVKGLDQLQKYLRKLEKIAIVSSFIYANFNYRQILIITVWHFSTCESISKTRVFGLSVPRTAVLIFVPRLPTSDLHIRSSAPDSRPS